MILLFFLVVGPFPSASEAEAASCVPGGGQCLAKGTYASLGLCCSGFTCAPAPAGGGTCQSNSCLAPGSPCQDATNNAPLGQCCNGPCYQGWADGELGFYCWTDGLVVAT